MCSALYGYVIVHVVGMATSYYGMFWCKIQFSRQILTMYDAAGLGSSTAS